MKTLLKMTFVLFALFTSMKTQAQSLVGLWSEPTFQMQLQLNADGSYQLQYAQGNSYGQYALQGNQFWLQDAYGNTMAYTTHLLTFNNFQISDANGTVMNFVNQNPTTPSHSSSTSMASTSKVTVPWEQAQYNKELANKDGQILKEKEVRIYATLLEFLIEVNLQPYQINQLQQAVLADFQASPSALLQDAGQVGNALKIIYAQTDFVQIGAARQELFANLHGYVLQNPALQQSPFFKILYQHLQVLAYDAANKLVLTDKDVAAYLAYIEFTNSLMGVQQTFSAQERQIYQQQVTNGFGVLPLQQKQVLCSARLLWQVVQMNWNQMTTSQQQQVKTQMTAQSANLNYGHHNNTTKDYSTMSGEEIMADMGLANPNTHNPNAKDYSKMTGDEIMADLNADLKRWADAEGMTIEEYKEYRRGFNSSMKIMQRSSMESHATMMNVINNMGGGNAYWSVHDTDSSGNIIW